MRLHVDFFEFVDRYPGINLCGFQFGMTQHLLASTGTSNFLFVIFYENEHENWIDS